MAKITILFAVLLILLGLVGYFGTPTSDDSTTASESAAAEENSGNQAAESGKQRSVTALIPAMVGGLLLVFGAMAFQERLLMHAMHAAVFVGLLGFIAGAGRGSMGLVKLMSADDPVNTRSLSFVWLMAILCGVYVGLCVNSFIQARRRRKAGEGAVEAA